MICPRCGLITSDDSKFCGNCGAIIKKEILLPQEFQDEKYIGWA